MTAILSETFAPPKIATNGRFGFSTASPMNLISFPLRNQQLLGYQLKQFQRLRHVHGVQYQKHH